MVVIMNFMLTWLEKKYGLIMMTMTGFVLKKLSFIYTKMGKTQGKQLKHAKRITGHTLLQIASSIFIQLLKKFQMDIPQHT
ncbi:hypothetical protein CLOSYM_00851 [[Clostridium] symbiosum ATCC 14940]|uniref:Transposase DDE domain-containing protein n=1 Tax=[Clostridium] symbiosum ATCC 14940 TaxID=411472 RepID=A0ABC9U1Q3_CLOSY|nr:hypothetical protein CLOSYM_00851 [[Clostridium] symbiosum ATCC 14940]